MGSNDFSKGFKFLSAALLLSACSCRQVRGPDYEIPDIPHKAEWSRPESGAGDINPEWWREFNDPALTGLVESAISGNFDLAVAAGRSERARAVVEQVAAGRRPSLTLSAGTEFGVQGDDSANSDRYESYQTGAALGWEIDLWGKLKKGVEAARADYSAVGADYQTAYLMLAADVASVYFDLRSIDADLDIYGRTIAATASMVELYRARAEEDIVGQDVVLRQQAELRRLQREREDLLRERQILENALATLVGKPAAALKIPAGEAYKQLTTVEVPLGLPADILKRRPDIMAAEFRVLSAYKLLGKARLERLPSISLTARGGTASPSIGSLLSQWLVGGGPSITIPILNSGIRAEITVREADHKIARDQYRSVVIRAFQEVEDALVNRASYERQSVVAAQELKELAKVRSVTVAKVEEGLASQLELLESDRKLLASERTVNDLKFRQLKSSVNLFKALGGGWQQ